MSREIPQKDLILEIVARFPNGASVEEIRKQAKEFIPPSDQLKFIEVVETELMSLHEGNISRYGLRLSEYEKWHERWK